MILPVPAGVACQPFLSSQTATPKTSARRSKFAFYFLGFRPGRQSNREREREREREERREREKREREKREREKRERERERERERGEEEREERERERKKSKCSAGNKDCRRCLKTPNHLPDMPRRLLNYSQHLIAIVLIAIFYLDYSQSLLKSYVSERSEPVQAKHLGHTQR